MDKNRIEGAAEQGERARFREALVIEAKRRKSGGCAASIKVHFHTEEAEPTWTSRNKFKEHQEIHYSLVANADRMRNRSYSNPNASSDLLNYVANEVIMDHIFREVLRKGV